MFWIRDSEVIGCQSPNILTPDLAEPQTPRYELTPDLHELLHTARKSSQVYKCIKRTNDNSNNLNWPSISA